MELGEVRLSQEPYLVHRSRGCLVWEVDCASKYPAWHVSQGEDVELMLYADERTLRKDTSTDRPTVVQFRGYQGWQIMLDQGKYSQRICFYRWQRHPRGRLDRLGL